MFSANARRLFWDLVLLGVSIGFAVVLARTDLLLQVLTQTQQLEIAGSFVAGMFFTSIFTAAPSIATLIELSRFEPLWMTVLFGAAGAVVGDLVIFRFVRDRFAEHLMQYLRMWGGTARLEHFLTRKSSHWIAYIVGGIVIASPLPDELAIALLGASGMSLRRFVPLAFAFNALGILLILLASRAL